MWVLANTPWQLRISPGQSGSTLNMWRPGIVRARHIDCLGNNYPWAIEDFDRRAYAIRGNNRQAPEDLKTAANLGYEDVKQFLRSQGIK
jgi:hypothetical protein